ncbi:hypothetical protein HY419_01255 [candidate division WWE3 bacterium]|nr:hypothetical protein [candidate division WWE3 bacterium]
MSLNVLLTSGFQAGFQNSPHFDGLALGVDPSYLKTSEVLAIGLNPPQGAVVAGISTIISPNYTLFAYFVVVIAVLAIAAYFFKDKKEMNPNEPDTK